MAINSPSIAVPSIERGKVRTVAIPTVYVPPDTNPATVSSSSTLVYTESTVTNYAVASESFTDTSGVWRYPIAYNINYFTFSADSVVSPVQVMSADRLTSNPNYGEVYLRQLFTLGKTVPYTFSVYMKVPTGTATISIALKTTTFFTGLAIFAQNTVTLNTSWQRFSVTGTPPDTETFMVQIGGDGTWGLNQSVDLWGAQLEESSTMSTYVSTGNGTFANSSGPVSQTFTSYEEISNAPVTVGQIVSYSSGGTSKLYVAVDIDGVITWKPCIAISRYIDPRTGKPYDSNASFYSPLVQ